MASTRDFGIDSITFGLEPGFQREGLRRQSQSTSGRSVPPARDTFPEARPGTWVTTPGISQGNQIVQPNCVHTTPISAPVRSPRRSPSWSDFSLETRQPGHNSRGIGNSKRRSPQRYSSVCRARQRPAPVDRAASRGADRAGGPPEAYASQAAGPDRLCAGRLPASHDKAKF